MSKTKNFKVRSYNMSAESAEILRTEAFLMHVTRSKVLEIVIDYASKHKGQIPRGKKYDTRKTYSLSPEFVSKLEMLCSRHNCKQSELIDQAVILWFKDKRKSEEVKC